MARNLFFTMLMFGCTILCGSCSKLVEVHCSPKNAGSFILLAGFDSSEVSSITIIKYLKGDGLKTPIDTHIVKPDYSTEPQHRDTLYPGAGAGLGYGYDWKVTVAPAHREWRVTDIGYEDVVHFDRPSSVEQFGCYISSYVVDSQKMVGGAFLLIR